MHNLHWIVWLCCWCRNYTTTQVNLSDFASHGSPWRFHAESISKWENNLQEHIFKVYFVALVELRYNLRTLYKVLYPKNTLLDISICVSIQCVTCKQCISLSNFTLYLYYVSYNYLHSFVAKKKYVFNIFKLPLFKWGF